MKPSQYTAKESEKTGVGTLSTGNPPLRSSPSRRAPNKGTVRLSTPEALWLSDIETEFTNVE